MYYPVSGSNFVAVFYIYIIWMIKLLYCMFQIDNLFCLGSPLSVFLALRMRNPQAPGHVETILPPCLCNRFYNVFHPSDPVAYRYELFYIKITFTLTHRMAELIELMVIKFKLLHLCSAYVLFYTYICSCPLKLEVINCSSNGSKIDILNPVVM